jgi:hypothetical protein
MLRQSRRRAPRLGSDRHPNMARKLRPLCRDGELRPARTARSVAHRIGSTSEGAEDDGLQLLTANRAAARQGRTPFPPTSCSSARPAHPPLPAKGRSSAQPVCRRSWPPDPPADGQLLTTVACPSRDELDLDAARAPGWSIRWPGMHRISGDGREI